MIAALRLTVDARQRAWLGLLHSMLLAALCACLTVSSARAEEVVLVAQVNGPVRIGNQSFQGGTIYVRAISSYNPVIHLHELCVNDTCLGLVFAEREGQTPVNAAALVFDRDPSGSMVLTGYRLRHGNGTVAYRLLNWEPAAPPSETGILVTDFRMP